MPEIQDLVSHFIGDRLPTPSTADSVPAVVADGSVTFAGWY